MGSGESWWILVSTTGVGKDANRSLAGVDRTHHVNDIVVYACRHRSPVTAVRAV